ncbi:MAG: hypothetical protein IKP96_04800 [Elusimicrobiaceae bacterium]|nr:hypothetical protein [Elusimicrobiaceae bacterium]
MKYKIRTLSEKEAICKYYEKNGWKATFEKYAISRQTLVHWRRRIKEAKPSVAHPLSRKIQTRSARPEIIALVKKLHKEDPSLSLEQIRLKVCKKQNISRTVVWHIVQGHK